MFKSLLFTKSKIEEVLYGSEVALNTCQSMMKLWRKLEEMHDQGYVLVLFLADLSILVQEPCYQYFTFNVIQIYTISLRSYQYSQFTNESTSCIRKKGSS